MIPQKLSKIIQNLQKKFNHVHSIEELKTFQRDSLGKKSELSQLLKSLKDLPEEERKKVGPEMQRIRQEWDTKISHKKETLETQALNEKLEKDWIDVTKSYPFRKGNIHPMSKVQRRIEEIFTSMGFAIADGPEVDTEWNNFDALNIPGSHPARDMQDTFWVHSKNKDPKNNSVLRTQTSDVQIREMQTKGAPIRIIVPGRVFRNEDVDASHDAVFYQVEGLMVDEGISLAHLKGTIETMLTELFERETHVRFRPGYFPFVEPGLEVDFSCALCSGKGCRVCKNTGWIEFMGAGMVHPNVLRNCDVDPEKYSGFAFGFGLTRLVMMKYEIDDIRLLFSNKKEFLEQF